MDGNLKQRRILVVEDEFFIADEICDALQRCEADVVGPAPNIREARVFAERERLDCAVLDINLGGEMVFEFATELRDRHVPVVFATGYEAPVIPEEFAAVPRFEKPLRIRDLVRAVARECQGRAA